MENNTPILEFRNVTMEKEIPFDIGLTNIAFTLRAGELAVALLEKPHWILPLADAAQGLVSCKSGEILFDGHDWQSSSPDQQTVMRSQIGRVFEGPDWISNLDIDENVTLAKRYHTDRAEQDIYDEANQLAQEFGLKDGLPHARPVAVPRDILRRSEWVRAFLGNPKLILLERPTRDLPEEWNKTLLNKVHEVIKKGTAVLWTMSNQTAWSQIDTKPSLKFKMQQTMMVSSENNHG